MNEHGRPLDIPIYAHPFSVPPASPPQSTVGRDVVNSTIPSSLFEQSTPTSSTCSLQTPTPQSMTFNLEHDHPVPAVPSTFLPSYYPESRDRMPLLPSQRDGRSRTSLHTAADVDRISALGPGPRHLLDGVALGISPPRPPRPTIATPTYDIAPTAYSRGLNRHSDLIGQKTRGEWNDLPFEIEGGSSGSYPSHSGLSGSLPNLISAGQGGHGYSTASPGQNPNGQMNAGGYETHASQASRSYPSHDLSDTAQNSMGYSDMPFGNGTQMQEGSMPSWTTDESKVSGGDYAKALKIYEQLHSSIPHIRPLSSPAPMPPGQEYENLLRLAQDGIAAVTGQQIPVSIIRSSGPTDISRSSSITGPSGRRAHAGKDKAPTKCLGCGATETPEWRRGPLGPRTLCNACGLVHMKLQRKKRKLEEKAAAAAAAGKN